MNSKKEQTNSEATNLENESYVEQPKDPNYLNEQTEDNKLDDKSIEFKDGNQSKKPRESRRVSSTARSSSKNQNSRYSVGTNKNKPRDNSSRFDD